MIALQEPALRDQRLRRLYGYWRERHVGDRPPSRAELDPLDFPYAVGFVTLVDVEPEPLRFRFRLVASPVTQHLGYELTGKYLDEVPEQDMRSYLDSAYRRLVAERIPLHENGERVLDERIWRHESMLLPCCSPNGAVSLIISARVTQLPVAVDSGLPRPPG